MIMNCAVIDDDLVELTTIEDTLKKVTLHTDCPFHVMTFHNPGDKGIMEDYDIYVLDIDMPEINGFELATKIYDRNQNAIIVFCTNHENLVFESFKLNAFYFVRKSRLEEDLVSTIKKFLNSSPQNRKTYTAKTKYGEIKLLLKDIVYFTVAGNDLYIHLKNGNDLSERKALKKLYEEISADYEFIQISQNYLVNAAYITDMKGNELTVGGNTFTVPKANLRNVQKQYGKFLSR